MDIFEQLGEISWGAKFNSYFGPGQVDKITCEEEKDSLKDLLKFLSCDGYENTTPIFDHSTIFRDLTSIEDPKFFVRKDGVKVVGSPWVCIGSTSIKDGKEEAKLFLRLTVGTLDFPPGFEPTEIERRLQNKSRGFTFYGAAVFRLDEPINKFSLVKLAIPDVFSGENLNDFVTNFQGKAENFLEDVRFALSGGVANAVEAAKDIKSGDSTERKFFWEK